MKGASMKGDAMKEPSLISQQAVVRILLEHILVHILCYHCGFTPVNQIVHLNKCPCLFDSTIHIAFLLVLVIGCPTFKPPKGSWAKRKGDKLKVHCNQTGKTWTLECSGSSWVGEVGACEYGKQIKIS